MLKGNPKRFAIESGISAAYSNIGARALGFFVVHLLGHQFGVKRPDATLLACSFDEVCARSTRRGTHTAPFSHESNAFMIANACYNATYNECMDCISYLGLSCADLNSLVHTRHLFWAPDGDQAFDDGSCILHLDLDRSVQLIAFRASNRRRVIPASVVSTQLGADEFYGVLNDWSNNFAREWEVLPKQLLE